MKIVRLPATLWLAVAGYGALAQPEIRTQPADASVSPGATETHRIPVTRTVPRLERHDRQHLTRSIPRKNPTRLDLAGRFLALTAFTLLADQAHFTDVTTPVQLPVISSQPIGREVHTGEEVRLSVIAWGTGPLTYQWRKDGTDLLNATHASLALTSVSLANAGDYTVEVSNAVGSVTSEVARVTVAARPWPYFADFEGAVGLEWSVARIETTPIGNRRFLGQFSNETVNLTLSALPPHHELIVSLDLYLMFSWDGNDTGGVWPGTELSPVRTISPPVQGPVHNVATSGTRALVSVGDATVALLDLRDPANPVWLGSWESLFPPSAFVLAGSTAFIASYELDFLSTVEIVDFTDPAQPVLKGYYDTEGYVLDLAVAGNRLYVADDEAGLAVVDLGNPGNVRPLGTHRTWGVQTMAVAGTTSAHSRGTSGWRRNTGTTTKAVSGNEP